MTEIRNLRRYALLKGRAAAENGDYAIRDLWRWKQAQIAGTALPDDFPLRERLVALFYTHLEDLDGADSEELADVGFSASESADILAAASGET